jgi:hypothetical protein
VKSDVKIEKIRKELEQKKLAAAMEWKLWTHILIDVHSSFVVKEGSLRKFD